MLRRSCLSTQTSADLPPGFQVGTSESVGALTSTYLPLLSKGLSWATFVSSLRQGLKKSKLEQVPQLEVQLCPPLIVLE